MLLDFVSNIIHSRYETWGSSDLSLLFGSPFGLHLQDLTDKLEGLHFSVFFQEHGPTVRC